MKILKAKKEILHTKEHSYVIAYEAYNKQGNLVKSEEYTEDQTLLQRTTLLYNDADLVVKEQHEDAEGVYEVIDYQYDEQRNIIETINTFVDGEKQVRKYSIQPTTTEMVLTDEKGGFQERELSHLNEEGKVVESSRFNQENQLVVKEKFHYHDNGEISAYQSTDGEGNVLAKTGLDYNEDGNLIASWEEDEFGKTSWRYEYEVGEEGETIAKRYHIESNTLDSVHTQLIDGDYEKEIREIVGVQLEIVESTPIEYHHQTFDVQEQLLSAHKISYDEEGFIQEEYFFNADAFTQGLPDEAEKTLTCEYLFWEKE